MRIIFAGTPAFSVTALNALHAAGHQIIGVYTQPDRPAGRGQKLTASPVALRAEELGLATFKPVSFKKEPEAITQLAALKAEVMVVVAYGLILPQEVLDLPRHGCLNIHASLLPRWRGAAPIQRAMLAGDAVTGITIMQMDAGLDTGPMLLRGETAIADHHTAGSLHHALAAQGAALIVEALAQSQAGSLKPTPQPAEGATYAAKLTKDEARVDWQLSAEDIALRIRAYNPVPVAWTMLGEERVKFFAAAIEANELSCSPLGTVLTADDQGIRVVCGKGAVLITQAQRPGGRVQLASVLARDWDITGRQFR